MARKRTAGEPDYEGDLLDGSESIIGLIEQRDRSAINPWAGSCLQRAVGQVESTDGSADSATFTIVTRDKTRNRHGNQVQITPNELGGGIILESYAANPVVLWEHGLGGMPLALGTSESPDGELTVKLSKSKATATVYFSKLPAAQLIAAAIHEKTVRMASIAFNPRKAMKLKPPKDAQLPDGVEDLARYRQQYGLDFTEVELLEWSATLIGADRGSLRQALDRGKIHDLPLLPFMRQSFEIFVGDPQAWSPGWREPVAVAKQSIAADDEAADDSDDGDPLIERRVYQGIVIEGRGDLLDAFVEERQRAVESPAEEIAPAPVDTPAGIATTPERTIGIEQLTEALTQRIGNAGPVVGFDQVVAAVTQRVGTMVEQKLAPVLATAGRLESELKRMTGVVD